MTVSHLTTPTAEIEVGILNALTAGSFSHLTMSLAEIRARILNALNSGSVSYLTTSQATIVSGIVSEFASDGHTYSTLTLGKAEILAELLNDVQSGDALPDWVPDGATHYIDFVRAFQDVDCAWTATDGVVDITALVGADANTDSGWSVTTYDPENGLTASGYDVTDIVSNDPFALIGSARTAILAGATVRIEFECLTSEAGGGTFFVMLAANGNDAVELDISGSEIEAYSYGSSAVLTVPNVANTGDGAVNAAAITFDTALRYEFAVSGSEAKIVALTETDRPPGNPLVAVVVSPSGDFAVRSVTIKAALPSTTGLSALSETGVTNTAPTITNVDTTPTLTEAEAVTDSTIVTAEISDAEGNPITFSLTDDDGGNFLIDAVTGVVSCTDNLLAASSPFAFTIRATDPGGLFDDQVFTLTVTA